MEDLKLDKVRQTEETVYFLIYVCVILHKRKRIFALRFYNYFKTFHLLVIVI
jgi:hypothetical protein